MKKILMIKLLVKCPFCGNTMYCWVKETPYGKYKECVYCGRRFLIHGGINKSQILREIERKIAYRF